MGRPRTFDTAVAVEAAGDAFVRSGYAGTSVDDLLRATGIQRASLYSAFGSKRGLFVAALRQRTSADPPDLDLLLVALMDVAAHDDEVRSLTADALERIGPEAGRTLGTRLLQRARMQPASEGDHA